MERRMIELEMEGVIAKAVLFDKEMPKTSEAIWNLLPVKAIATHGIWVGREVWLPLDDEKFLKLEQEWRPPLFVEPGDLVYAYRQPHLSRGKTSGRDELAEIAVYYGRDCRLWNVRGGPMIRGKTSGYPTHGSRMQFGKIVENFEAFEAKLNTCRREGSKEIIIRRA